MKTWSVNASAECLRFFGLFEYSYFVTVSFFPRKSLCGKQKLGSFWTGIISQELFCNYVRQGDLKENIVSVLTVSVAPVTGTCFGKSKKLPFSRCELRRTNVLRRRRKTTQKIVILFYFWITKSWNYYFIYCCPNRTKNKLNFLFIFLISSNSRDLCTAPSVGNGPKIGSIITVTSFSNTFSSIFQF